MLMWSSLTHSPLQICFHLSASGNFNGIFSIEISIGLRNGLVPIWRQGIYQTNDVLKAF